MVKVAFLIEEDQTYRVIREPLQQSEVIAALKRVGQEGFSKVNAVAEIDGNPVTLCHSPENCLAMVKVPSFTIRTFAKQEGEVLYPTFTILSGDVERSMRWTAPEGMRLFMAVKASPDEEARKWRHIESYFFAKSDAADRAGFYRIPLPNLYADGRICLGRNYDGSAANLIGVLKKSLAQLNESSWNTDLIPVMDRCRELFRFNPSTLQSLPPVGPWENSCTRINRVEMEALHD